MQVCKDVRSDIESSSEEEAAALKASHAPHGENGTNGHCARPRTHNHSGW